MSKLREVDSADLLDVYNAEQTALLMEAIYMSNRIHKAYRNLHNDRINAYLNCNDEFYDYYQEAEWVLFNATFEIEHQVCDQADIVACCCSQYYCV